MSSFYLLLFRQLLPLLLLRFVATGLAPFRVERIGDGHQGERWPAGQPPKKEISARVGLREHVHVVHECHLVATHEIQRGGEALSGEDTSVTLGRLRRLTAFVSCLLTRGVRPVEA